MDGQKNIKLCQVFASLIRPLGTLDVILTRLIFDDIERGFLCGRISSLFAQNSTIRKCTAESLVCVPRMRFELCATTLWIIEHKQTFGSASALFRSSPEGGTAFVFSKSSCTGSEAHPLSWSMVTESVEVAGPWNEPLPWSVPMLRMKEAVWHSEDRASWYILTIKANKMDYVSTLFL